MSPDYANKRGLGSVTFTAQFGSKVTLFWARTLPMARQAAIEHFKPKKGELAELRIREGKHASVP